MSIKEIKSDILYKEYSLQIPYKEIDDLINNKIKEIIPTVTLPGFRKGKAPISIVKKKYESNVLSEVIEKIVQEKTKSLLDEKKLKPFRQPRVDLKKYEKKQPVQIEIKIDLEPKIVLKDFKDLKLKKYKIELDKKTIDDNYNQFLSSQKNYKKLESNRVVKNSDRINLNIVSKDSTVPEFLKSQKNFPLVTDSEYQVLPDLGKKLIQKKVKVGDKLILDFDISKIENSKTSKIVDFEIEILSIEESIPFKINDEYLQKSGFKSENELKESLEKNIKFQYQNGIEQIEKKQLMDALDLEHNFELPKGILDEEFHAIWHRLEHAKKDNTLDQDDKNLTDDELKKRYKKISERRVKLAILLQYIAKNENVSVSEKELTDGMINYASKYPGQEKQILDYFKKNPSSIESIRGPILEQKVIDNITSKSKFSEEKLSIKEYIKLEEKTFKINNKEK